MKAPESTGKLETLETNPLPHVSSARAWDVIASQPLVTLPKSTPIIREKVGAVGAPKPPKRIRADGTEEICADDIMLIVPARQASSEELGDADIEVEHAEPEPAKPPSFHPPAYSIHATQEILADDVLEVVRALPSIAQQQPQRPVAEERPSSVPPAWTVDAAADEFEFPTPPQYSGQHAAISARITAYSATQVFRRRSANMKVVIASVSLAASVMMIAGIAKLMPNGAANSDGPVGISVRSPKKLDASVRARVLAYGRATHVTSAEVAAVSIDSLPTSTSRVFRRRR